MSNRPENGDRIGTASSGRRELLARLRQELEASRPDFFLYLGTPCCGAAAALPRLVVSSLSAAALLGAPARSGACAAARSTPAANFDANAGSRHLALALERLTAQSGPLFFCTYPSPGPAHRGRGEADGGELRQNQPSHGGLFIATGAANASVLRIDGSLAAPSQGALARLGDFLHTHAQSLSDLTAAAGRPAGRPAPLTAAQRTCLYWTAHGKTSWETARILGRAEATVNHHIRNAIHRLEAANKTEAVFKAACTGLIAPASASASAPAMPGTQRPPDRRTA